MKEMSPSLPSMIGEIPPINSQETESLRSYAIPAPPAHLPEACQGWIQIAARRQQFFDSLRDEKPFLLGSDSCCAICYTLQEAFSTIWPNDRSRVPLKVTLSESDHQFVELSRFVVARYRFLVPHGTLSPWGHIFPTLVPETSNVCDKIHGMISRCASTHQCYDNDTEPGMALPTRVLDISRGADEIYLRESVGLHGRYVCLSHSWGSKLPLHTTTDNIDGHRQGIAWDTFPVVYKETIAICWKLGVKYVWIDSLCIIQDSKSDWVSEARTMCQVYSNAYLTVAATASADCSVSMMQPLVSPSRRPYTKSMILKVGGREPHVLMCVQSWRYNHWNDNEESRKMYKKPHLWPLRDRAWAFQERILSSRVIDFNGPELVWTCKHGTVCGCTSTSDLRHRAIERAESFYRQLEGEMKLGGSEGDFSKRLAEVWRTGVRGYTECNLTYAIDKLPALSGMAHMFARKRPYATYIAGAWYDTTDPTSLIGDLLWYQGRDQLFLRMYYHRHRCDQWIAPTFSWASVRGQVIFPTSSLSFLSVLDQSFESCMEKTYVEVLEARCEPSTEDPMGQITSGVLKIKGRALRGRVTIPEDGGKEFFQLNGVEEVFAGCPKDRQPDMCYCPDRFGVGPQVGRGIVEGGNEKDLVCVPWAVVWSKRVADHGTTNFSITEYAMVLRCTATTVVGEGIFGRNEFNRVGMLIGREVYGVWKEPGGFEAALAAYTGIFDDNGGEVHTFTIV